MDSSESDNESMAHWQASDIDHLIRHVTVRQLIEADQMHSTAPFKIEGKEFKRFILVANICYLDERETYRDIGLDDGTGRIKAREWNEKQKMESSNGRYQTSNFPYVRVVGELEQFRNRNMVKILDIETILSPYEPYYHVLHAVHDTLVQERGPPPINVSVTTLQGVPQIEFKDQEGRLTSNYDLMSPNESQDIPLRATPAPSPTYAADPNHYEGDRSLGSYNNSYAEGASKQRARPCRHNTQIGRLTEHTASLSLVSPHSPLSPVISSTSHQPQLASRKHDPYSNLTALERDIILCIKTAATQYAKESIYPSVRTSQHREATWKGLDFSVIVAVITSQHPTLSPEELHKAFEHLLDESYVFNPVDEEHFDCI